jgi:hypothetical protein
MEVASVFGQLQRIHGAGVLARAVRLTAPPALAHSLGETLTDDEDAALVALLAHTAHATPSGASPDSS